MKTNDKKHLTSENGRPIADNQNTQTSGHRGPVTLQYTWLLEKMSHFDREVILKSSSSNCISATVTWLSFEEALVAKVPAHPSCDKR